MTTIRTIDLSPLTDPLDAREMNIIEEYAPDVAAGLAAVVAQGATDDAIKAALRPYVGDNLIQRIPPAARHLRRQREAQ